MTLLPLHLVVNWRDFTNLYLKERVEAEAKSISFHEQLVIIRGWIPY